MYVNLNNPANFQLQEFEQLGFRYIVTGRPTISGETYRTIFVLADAVVTATCPNGDSLSSETLVAGTVIHGFFESVSVASGSLLAYKAGPITVQEIFDAYKAYVYANGGIVEGESCAVADIAALLAEGLYSMASLVLIPSGYKVSHLYAERPLDSNGDLTFARASSATRVNSSGLVEKVRTNVLLQSNSFDTTWSTSNATVTSGQAGYDGTNNAWELNSSASGGSLLQSNTQSGLQTFSVYAKGSVSTGIRLYAFGSVNVFAYFNLNTGALGSVPSGVSAKIEAVGGGWYRCSMSFDQTNTQVRFYTTNNNNANAAGIVYIQAAQLETSDIATDYIVTTTAAVSVGPVANLPRLDYTDSTCPRLLLEPQRTNLVTYSENFDNWSFIGATANPNVSASPDGYQSADKIIGDGSSTNVRTYNALSTSAGVNTFSVFLKSGNTNFAYVEFSGFGGITGTTAAYFDLANGTTPTSGANIEDYGNGYYRCSISATIDASDISGNVSFRATPSTIASSFPTAGDADGKYIYAWGAQLEVGSYATSYIPTLGAAVTRGRDIASKTSATDLIGQIEGTLFVDFDMTQTSDSHTPISIADGTSTSNFVLVYKLNTNFLSARIRVGGVDQPLINSPVLASGRHKFAFAYKQNDLAFYVDGVLAGTSSSANIPAVLSRLSLNEIGVDINQMFGGTRQALVFKTRLTNAQLAELTTL